jgi:hypothetical protein
MYPARVGSSRINKPDPASRALCNVKFRTDWPPFRQAHFLMMARRVCCRRTYKKAFG